LILKNAYRKEEESEPKFLAKENIFIFVLKMENLMREKLIQKGSGLKRNKVVGDKTP